MKPFQRTLQAILLPCFFLFSLPDCAGQQNLREDKELVNNFLLCVSHGGYPFPPLSSKAADTAQLHKKLRILGIRWAKHDYRRDSIVLSGTHRLPVEGTRRDVVLVYFKYRNLEWDELLLLVNRDDNLLMDIANNSDVFFFDKSLRLRYHRNKTGLYNYFFPTFSRADEMADATRTIVRLALKNDKDSLKQQLLLKDTAFKKFTRLGEAWMQDQEDQYKTKMEVEVRKKIQDNIASPASLVADGNFTSDPKAGTCKQIFRCTKKGKQVLFAFKKQDGRYLLFDVHVY